MIAALYVQRGGAYYGIPDVDPWDVARDARLYPGPHPVVAHPPCARWCQLAGMVEAKHPHLRRGDDGGTFAAALASVRQWGGVLEHPAYSAAWDAHGIGKPPTGGGWVHADFVGGWTCCVEQIAYGHRARKRTWMYACGVADLPSLRWSVTNAADADAVVSYMTNKSKRTLAERMSRREASATPAEFREVLLAMARSVPSRAPR